MLNQTWGKPEAMVACRPKARYLFYPLVLVLLFTGCFSIPFLSKSSPQKSLQPQKRDFDRDNVFVGYDSHHRPIVEMRLVNQELSSNGLTIYTRLFPTENFKVRNIFRGLRSINYYPIERRFHRLELKAKKRKFKAKVKDNLQVKDQKPLDAVFERSGVFTLLPDTVDQAELKFQDVKYWRKLPADSLGEWYAEKENFLDALDRRQRRNTLVDSYRRRQKQDNTATFHQYDSLFVTNNSAYVYLEKNVDSDVLLVLNAGDRLDYGVSDGLWVEVPLPDTLTKKLTPMFEQRHEQALEQVKRQKAIARTRTAGRPMQTTEAPIDTTYKTTAFMLDVMVDSSYNRSIQWERSVMPRPVDVPYFAQVLVDREKARQARLDSIAQARLDSLARVKAVADSVLKAKAQPADTTRADTSSARKLAAAGAASPSNPADSSKAMIPSDTTGAASRKPVQTPAAQGTTPETTTVNPDSARVDSSSGGGDGSGRGPRGGRPRPARAGSGQGGQPQPNAPADTAQAPGAANAPVSP